ncbi:MAG: hypothetical protein N2253_05355 [Bacteroidia bacterium]|nr:hypothetical protein [Bacteroidia bacterium]MCX7764300.1 hypothetical protein [Bacteroidia bacterium]MDW8057468.1 hypothetical protein [Bacteroidia bacterium]
MGARSLIVAGLLWAQVKPKIHYLPQIQNKTITWIAVAWTHAPHQWEIGEILTSYLVQEAKRPPFREQAESLGLLLDRWCNAEGAGLTVVAPRAHLIAAVEWLYSLFTRLPHAPDLSWQSAFHTYRKQWEGFSLERELFWRLYGSPTAPGTLSWEQVTFYLQTHLTIENLHLIVSGNPSFREKNYLDRLHPPLVPEGHYPANTATQPDLRDTVEQNLWAYPAYVALLIELPQPWAEKIAFLQAFFSRWHREAPPLRWKGQFWSSTTYLLQARLDGKSYNFLRNLRHLAPCDSAELLAWQAAYTLSRHQLLFYPQLHPEVWLTATVRGDSIELPDTLPSQRWWRGWSFSARGIWLLNDWLAVDTLLRTDTFPLPSPSKVAPPDFVWTGEGELPLSEWASALQLFWGEGQTSPCELIGYYKRVKERSKRLRHLHELRRRLIQQYHVPPEALRITLRLMPPDLSPKAIRLKCYAP